MSRDPDIFRRRTRPPPAQGNSDKAGTIHCDNAYFRKPPFLPGLTQAETSQLLGLLSDRYSCRVTRINLAASLRSNWANILTNQTAYLPSAPPLCGRADCTFGFLGKDGSGLLFPAGASAPSIKIYNLPLSNAPNSQLTIRPLCRDKS